MTQEQLQHLLEPVILGAGLVYLGIKIYKELIDEDDIDMVYLFIIFTVSLVVGIVLQ